MAQKPLDLILQELNHLGLHLSEGMPGKSGFSGDYHMLRKPCRKSFIPLSSGISDPGTASCTSGLAVAKKDES